MEEEEKKIEKEEEEEKEEGGSGIGNRKPLKFYSNVISIIFQILCEEEKEPFLKKKIIF